jgi:hypothetical protein
MRKDKTYELRIDEDDDISGIDSISLVDDPAIEIGWVAFNKHKHSTTQEHFDIPDGEDMKFSSRIIEKGHVEQELFNDGWEVAKQDFVSSSSNAPSFEDTEERLIRYKYVLNPSAPGAPIKSTTREFCRDLLNKNLVYRVEDLERITNDLGSSALVWRGSYNCRHKWMRIEYRRGADIINKGSITKGRIDGEEGYDIMGLPQPDTRTSNPSFSKEYYQEDCPRATQDVEVNLRNRQKAIVKAHYGPLNPNEPNEDYWEKKAKMFGGDLESAKKARCGNCAFFVQTKNMLDCIEEGIGEGVDPEMIIDAGELGYCEAFDFKCAASRTCDAWVVGGPIVDEDMGYDVGGLPSYVDQVSGDTVSKSIAFESYTDYPESVRTAAQRALDWVEENGWGSCGTPVGKARANQLAKGEPISEETISRMASFARHAQNKDVPYSEGCGGLMWDAWGGTAGIEWASNKLEEINKTNMSKQKFQTDDEKKMVVGPAMIPDLKIFRKDLLGNPYYVYFSANTIKMIAEKYMRNKYIDNNDENHNGKAVSDVYVVESWIKEDKEDKSNKYGYGNLPVGTWFVSMKVRNDEVWKKVKNGELKGFSVSGFFEEIADFAREHMFLQEVVKILKTIK